MRRCAHARRTKRATCARPGHRSPPRARRRIQADQQPRHRALAAARTRPPAPACGRARSRNAHAVDHMHELARLALQHAVEPGRRDLEGLRQTRTSTSGALMPLTAFAADASRRRAWAAAISSGRSLRQSLEGRGQRGLKAQPAGVAQPRHRPVDLQQALAPSSIAGIEPIRPTVYGCAGRWITSSTGADLDDAAGVHHRHASRSRRSRPCRASPASPPRRARGSSA